MPETCILHCVRVCLCPSHHLKETTWEDPRLNPAFNGGTIGGGVGGLGRFSQQQQQQLQQQQGSPFFTPSQDSIGVNDIMHAQQVSAPHPQAMMVGDTRRRSASLLDQRAVAHGGRPGANVFAQHQKELSALHKQRQQQLLEEAQRRVQKPGQGVSSHGLMNSGGQSWHGSGAVSPGANMPSHMKDASGDASYRHRSPDPTAVSMQQQALGREGAFSPQGNMRPGYVPGSGPMQGRMNMQSGYQPGLAGGAGGAGSMSEQQRQALLSQNQAFLQQGQQQSMQQQQAAFGGSGYSTPSDMDTMLSGVGDQPGASIAMDLGSPGGNLPMMMDATLDSNRFNLGYGGQPMTNQMQLSSNHMMQQSGQTTFL